VSRRVPPLAAAVLLAAILTAGCSGPDRPLDVGFKEVPSDVVLGAQSTPAPPVPGVQAPLPPPPPPFALPPPVSVVALPPPPFAVPEPSRPAPSPVPQPSRPACPAADPLQAPALEAPASIAGPPVDAAYLFRNDGTFEVSGADARKGRFPQTSLRVVKTVFRRADNALFDVQVAETLGDVTTTTTYRTTRATAVETAADGTVDPGLYILSVVSTREGETAVFNPKPALRLAALPLVRGARSEARGIDPETATTMSFTSVVAGKARVDACGAPLDSFTLELTEGRLLSSTSDLTFASTLAVGTQYGGIVLRETVDFKGIDAGAGISRTNTTTISQVPQAAAGSAP